LAQHVLVRAVHAVEIADAQNRRDRGGYVFELAVNDQ
jgi:hypothetical protein